MYSVHISTVSRKNIFILFYKRGKKAMSLTRATHKAPDSLRISVKLCNLLEGNTIGYTADHRLVYCSLLSTKFFFFSIYFLYSVPKLFCISAYKPSMSGLEQTQQQ